MSKLLFIGSFLSSTRGSKGVAESLAEFLADDGIYLELVSKYENKLLRILDILVAILFYRGSKIHIDVFSDNAFKIADLASRIARFRKKDILLTLHGGKLVEFANDHMPQVKALFQRASYIQTPSKYLQSFFAKQGFQIHYLPNPINLENFPCARTVAEHHTILWVRSFNAIYNPEVPIQILSKLKKHFPETTLTMIGPDRGLLKKCKNLAIELGVENSICFVGSVPNKELYKYYQSHEVYVNTTSYESFGVAVIEAASCGIPIVSNAVGEIPFLWEDKVDMLMVKNNNIDEYVDCLSALFKNTELSDRISLNANIKARAFEWSEIKEKWISLLKND